MASSVFSSRHNSKQPTVEIRIADVCLQADHAAALAVLCRALVETAAREWGEGKPVPPVPAELLRLASWRAGKSGLGDDLLHPLKNERSPVRAVVNSLLRRASPVLADVTSAQ
ncbi:hypothetical protein AAIH25_20545 [Arthrobacter crystallopoietes]|uniref:hypothetical protein n=1 Tax=Crystallibacter crystallopoietes TaxID=37928 RepID=UPI003D1CA64B